MRVRRVTLSKGRAAELAEHAKGFTANGASEFTRRAAHGLKVGPQDAPELPMMHLRKRIGLQVTELGKLEAKLMFARSAGDHSRADYLVNQMEIKQRFIARLQTEYETGRRI